MNDKNTVKYSNIKNIGRSVNIKVKRDATDNVNDYVTFFLDKIIPQSFIFARDDPDAGNPVMIDCKHIMKALATFPERSLVRHWLPFQTFCNDLADPNLEELPKKLNLKSINKKYEVTKKITNRIENARSPERMERREKNRINSYNFQRNLAGLPPKDRQKKRDDEDLQVDPEVIEEEATKFFEYIYSKDKVGISPQFNFIINDVLKDVYNIQKVYFD